MFARGYVLRQCESNARQMVASAARYLNTHRPDKTLVSADWVHKNCVKKPAANVKLVHVTWADDAAEYVAGHIDGAVFFPQVVDEDSKYLSMIPSAAHWHRHCVGLGIDDSTHVILYDCTSRLEFHGYKKDFQAVAAARAWWMFRVFGHHLVSVLDGGLTSWRNHGLPIHKGPPPTPSKSNKDFNVEFDRKLYATTAQVEAIAKGQSKEKLIDVRPEFEIRLPTTVPPNMDGIFGRIKSAIHIPFTNFIDLKTNRYKDPDEIRAIFLENGISPDDSMVTHCLAGLRACPVALAAFIAGNELVSVYDGSWNEYSQVGAKETLLFQ